MCADVVRKKNVVFDLNVTRQGHFVGKNIVVANVAIVSNVNSHHEEVSGTYSSNLAFPAGAMKGAELTNQVVVPDLQEAFFAFELHILGFAPEYGVFKNRISAAETCIAFDNGVCANLAAVTDFSFIFYDSERANLDILAE